MLLVIDEILDYLGDGEWHGFPEITRNFRAVEDKVDRILGFLADHGFIDLDREGGRVKINASFSRFLQAIRRLEGE